MKRALLAVAVASLIAACGDKRKLKPPPPVVADAAPVATATVDAGLPPRPPPLHVTPGRPHIDLMLRSTPPGATASVDGRVVGVTPLRWQIDDDGRAHDFAFVLGGHAPWRLRFAPSRDGAIHATLAPLRNADAGSEEEE
jgi:PEGA domain-containing protein